MRKAIVVLAVLISACTAPQTSENQEDSTAVVPEETESAVDDENFNDESYEAVAADTTLLSDIRSAFGEPQLNGRVAFVYRKEGLPVYRSLEDTGDPSKAADVIGYGTKIFLNDPLVNNKPSDKIIFEGFKGRYVAVKNDEGEVMYIFSGYITNFPVPGESDGLVDYFGSHFHLLSTPKKITSKTMADTDIPEWYKNNYQFEAGIVVDDNGYYEGSSTDITLPVSCTMQEGFLLLKSFVQMHVYDSVFNQYPAGGFEKSYGEFKNARVDSNDQDGITRIYIADEGGCIDETYVQKVEGRIVIGTGGGC